MKLIIGIKSCFALWVLVPSAVLMSSCAPQNAKQTDLTGESDVSPVQMSAQMALSSPAAVQENLPFHTDDAPVLNYAGEPQTQIAAQIDDQDGDLQLAPDLAQQGVSSGGLMVSVADAPLNGISKVFVTFSRVELVNRKSGQTVSVLSVPIQVDLLSLRDGLSKLFGQLSVPNGAYSQLRLFVDQVSVVIQGKEIEVLVPKSIKQSGIRVFGVFEVHPGAVSHAVLDFDLARLFLWSKLGILFRPVVKLRHLHFQPSGVHFEARSDGTMSLVGPAKTVRSHAWIQLTDVKGNIIRKRANSDGSFEFSGLQKIFGYVELAVLARKGEIEFNRREGSKGETGQFDVWEPLIPGLPWPLVKIKYVKLAWAKYVLDFQIDADRFPSILASHVNRLFFETFEKAKKEPSAFIARFKSDAFRFLGIKFLKSIGKNPPNDVVLPSLPVPYAFDLEGPEFDLPSYTFGQDSLGFVTGGPGSAGCLDAQQVFESTNEDNSYDGLAVDQALKKMIGRKMPFTGLLAEYELICKSRDLAQVSCSTLGSLAKAGNLSLPAVSLSDLPLALNSARGGLITALLGCVENQNFLADPVDLPQFPIGAASQASCWLGCAGDSQMSYLSSSRLMPIGVAGQILSDPTQIVDLDTLVNVAKSNGISPLVLAASYVADTAPSKVHGYADRNRPALFNLLPTDGSTFADPQVLISAKTVEKSITQVLINGQAVSFSQAIDGSILIGPENINLVEGLNQILIEAVDAAGNVGSAQLALTYLSPTPSPTPSPSPSVTPVPGVSLDCSGGQFVPKAGVVLGLSIDPNEGNLSNIVSGFQAIGYSPILYSDAEVAFGKPIADGVTVLAISRKVVIAPVDQSYIDGVKNFISAGGSLMGEYDGAALMFNAFSGSNNTILNLTPPLALFDGDVSGGGVLLPLSQSTTYVTDPNDPLMAGIPSSFLVGIRAAFSISNFNSNWLHESANFTSTGYLGLVPAGTFPAVLSGRCGGGRVVMFSMNYFQVIGNPPVDLLMQNSLNWLTGH